MRGCASRNVTCIANYLFAVSSVNHYPQTSLKNTVNLADDNNSKKCKKERKMSERTRKENEKPLISEVMGVCELAEYLRISVHTVYRLAEQGRLPGRKVGKRWRFHRDAIIAWLATHREENALRSTSRGGIAK